MKKLFAVLSLCMLFSMVPGMKVLAETQTAPGGEVQIEERAEINVPGSEMSQMYLKEYEAIEPWSNWTFVGLMTCMFLLMGVFVINTLMGHHKLFSHQTPISIGLIVLAIVGVVGMLELDSNIASREIRYKAALIEEISEAYINDNNEMPIQGEYQGAGESNLLYSLNIKELAKYEVSIANMNYDRFFIEEETGKIYYKVGQQEFIRPIES